MTNRGLGGLLSALVPSRPFFVAFLSLAFSFGLASSARAEAPADQTRRLLDELNKGPRAELISIHRGRALDALGRAKKAREQARPDLAQDLEHLAHKWATVARDLLRALEQENRAGEVERDLLAANRKVLRGRALLEETLARKNRALGTLREVEEKSKTNSSSP